MRKAALFVQEILEEKEHEKLISVLDEEMILGTSENAHIRLDDWRCSGIHALIKREGEHFKVIDLGSSYGTSHEDKSFSQKVFKEGELFKIGDHQLLFRSLEDDKLISATHYEYAKKDKDYENDIQLASEKTVLEVSLFWGEKILEIRQFNQGSKISIGNPRFSTFGVPEELLPDKALKEEKFSTHERQSSYRFS